MKKDKSFIRFKKTILIKGEEYTIKQVAKLKDDDGVEVDGLHDHIEKTISLNKNQTPKAKRTTFLHEFYHAYLYECHLREGLDSQMEEAIVEACSQATERHFDLTWKK